MKNKQVRIIEKIALVIRDAEARHSKSCQEVAELNRKSKTYVHHPCDMGTCIGLECIQHGLHADIASLLTCIYWDNEDAYKWADEILLRKIMEDAPNEE